jgi:hypothetical protein
MKKSLLLSVMFVFMASSAFAEASVSIVEGFGDAGKTLRGAPTGADTGSPLIGKLSTGVGLGMLVDDVEGSGYALVTQHKSGTKAYGSAYDSTALFVTDADLKPGTVFLDVPAKFDSTEFESAEGVATDGWKKL